MFRLRDGRTGSYVELAARPSVPLRVRIHGPGTGAGYGPADVRVLLVADVLIRIAELRGLQVLTVLAPAGLPAGALEQNVSLLGIHPPAACSSPREAEGLLGGPADVHVAGTTAGLGDPGHAVLIAVGPVDELSRQEADARTADPGGPGGGGDQLALRLALLSRPHHQQAALTPAVLADAGQELSSWRHSVAEWADEPSRPIPADTARAISIAFDDDLNTAEVLAVLHGVEADHRVPAGAKFETFAFADRVLGLELVREIGQPRR